MIKVLLTAASALALSNLEWYTEFTGYYEYNGEENCKQLHAGAGEQCFYLCARGGIRFESFLPEKVDKKGLKMYFDQYAGQYVLAGNSAQSKQQLSCYCSDGVVEQFVSDDDDTSLRFKNENVNPVYVAIEKRADVNGNPLLLWYHPAFVAPVDSAYVNGGYCASGFKQMGGPDGPVVPVYQPTASSTSTVQTTTVLPVTTDSAANSTTIVATQTTVYTTVKATTTKVSYYTPEPKQYKYDAKPYEKKPNAEYYYPAGSEKPKHEKSTYEERPNGASNLAVSGLALLAALFVL
jgi:hypothetical protein